MPSDPTFAAIMRAAVVPVVTLTKPQDGPALLAALVEGGITCVEIALRTDAAIGLIELAGNEFPELLVGAGTVLSAADVDRVADLGARFIVSPGLDESVVSRTSERGLLPVPGVATATEIQRALGLGLRRLKFFPAEPLGGVAALSAFAGPFGDVQFMPSGGVSIANVRSYLASPAVFAVSGGWMVPQASIEQGDFATVRDLSREIVDLVAGARAGTA